MCTGRRFATGKPESFNPLSVDFNSLGEVDEHPFRNDPLRSYIPINDVPDPDSNVDDWLEKIDRETKLANSEPCTSTIPADGEDDTQPLRIVAIKNGSLSGSISFSCQKAARFHL